MDLLDVLRHRFTDADGGADDLVADAARVDGWAPAAAEGVQVAAADAAVGDLDVDVGLLPCFGLERLPDHFAFGGVFVLAHPSLEFVVGAHGCARLEGGEWMDSEFFGIDHGVSMAQWYSRCERLE